jgi:ABC-type dipeptide/oligopeptide/nickel transport system permease component
MLKYIAKKIAIAVPVLFIVSVVVFALIRLTPSDPVRMMVPPTATEEVRENVRRLLHLDQPIYIQYGYFISGVFRGDFGRSYYLQQDVSSLIGLRLLNTLKLGGTALLLSYLIAFPIGILAAVYHRSWIDHVAMALAYAGQCIPGFVMSLILILIFALKFKVLPASGYTSWKNLILPASAIAFEGLTVAVRIIRTSMLEVLGQDYIRTLRAKGLNEKLVVWQHALKNSLISVITIFALELGWIFAGAVAVEVVFGWPGAGRMLVDAVARRDFPIVQALTLVLSAGVIGANLLADILYAAVNPRIRY